MELRSQPLSGPFDAISTALLRLADGVVVLQCEIPLTTGSRGVQYSTAVGMAKVEIPIKLAGAKVSGAVG